MRKFQRRKKYVIWSINPFEPGLKPNRREIAEFAGWAEKEGTSLLAVYVLQVPREKAGRDRGRLLGYVAEAEQQLRSYVGELDLEQVLTIKVLLTETISHQSAIRRLVRFAEDIRCPWIVVSTHGRAGIARLFRKEFAEELVSESRCPVLFLTRLPQLFEGRNRGALFVTDFSDDSRASFRDFLKTAQELSLRVVLYHQMSTGPMSVDGLGNGTSPARQKRWAIDMARRWSKIARKAGVEISFDLQSAGYPALLSQAILAAQKRAGTGMIVLTSYGGELASFLKGSTSRDILRANECPVWVYGPKSLQRRKGRSTSAGEKRFGGLAA